MPKITLVTGGARSGKSSFVLKQALQNPGKRAYIATATACDEEMVKRIEAHKSERGDYFLTIEEEINLNQALQKSLQLADIVIVDCLTVWLGNLFYHYKNEEVRIKKAISGLVTSLKEETRGEILFVTNEVGLGIIPADKETRLYRDLAGFLNQQIAAIADSVYLCVCGIAQKIK